MLVYVRPSSEAFPILHVLQKEWPRLPFTARIGRAHSYRARSASKKGTWLLLPILLRGSFRKHRGLSALTIPGSAENGAEELIAHGKKRIGLS